MDRHELKEQRLALPGAREEFPFGDEVSVFKVGERCSRYATSTESRCS